MTWNKTPIHIVFYKDTHMDRLERIVEVHCKDHHSTTKDMCMSLVNVCVENESPHASCIGDAGDIRVDMLT
jgi:hypothetical protein